MNPSKKAVLEDFERRRAIAELKVRCALATGEEKEILLNALRRNLEK